MVTINEEYVKTNTIQSKLFIPHALPMLKCISITACIIACGVNNVVWIVFVRTHFSLIVAV